MQPWTRANDTFLDPAVVARLGTLELKARDGRRRLPVGPSPQPVQGLQRRVRRVPPVHSRRRPLHDRLEGLRAQRSALRQEVRGRNQPRLPPDARRQRIDGATARIAASRSSNTRRASRRRSRYLMNRQRDARRPDRLRRSHRRDAAGERAAGHLRSILLTPRSLEDRPARRTSRSRCISWPIR